MNIYSNVGRASFEQPSCVHVAAVSKAICLQRSINDAIKYPCPLWFMWINRAFTSHERFIWELWTSGSSTVGRIQLSTYLLSWPKTTVDSSTRNWASGRKVGVFAVAKSVRMEKRKQLILFRFLRNLSELHLVCLSNMRAYRMMHFIIGSRRHDNFAPLSLHACLMRNQGSAQ